VLEARARLQCELGDHEGALALYARLHGRSKAPNAHSFGNEIANELTDLGRYEEAEATYRETLDSARARYGDNAPDVAPIERNLGLLARERGDFEAAEGHLARALDIYSTVFGASSLPVAQTRLAQADLAMQRGQLDEARAGFDSVLLIFQTELGPSHRYTAQVLHGLGLVSFFQQDYRASLAAYQRALALQLELLGPLHEEIGILYNSIGETRVALGDHQQALDDFDRALVVFASKPDHPDSMLPNKGYGQALLALGRADEAVEYLERALPLIERSTEETYDTADIRLTLAQALAALGRSPTRVRKLASKALEVFTDLGVSDRVEMANSILADSAN